MPADYDGVGSKVDILLYRDGAWFIVQSKTDQTVFGNLGEAETLPAAGSGR